MARTWGEFFFGTEESRKKAKSVLKEMRQEGRYSRPNLSNTAKAPSMTGTGRLRPEVKKNTKASSSAVTPSGSYFVTPKKTSGMTGTGRLRPEVKKKSSGAFTLGTGNQTPKKKAPVVAQAAPKSAAPTAAPKKPKGMTFQEAVRRNRTEEYTRAKMKPKGSLLGLLRKRKG